MQPVIDNEIWNDSNGTFDPVSAGSALEALEHPVVDEDESAAARDALAEYVNQETAYLEAAPATD